MRKRLLKTTTIGLLAAAILIALMAAACDGDGSSSTDGSPSTDASPNASESPSTDGSPTDGASPSPDGSPTATVTPGTGESPAWAVASYIDGHGLDGHRLDNTAMADCPLEDVLGTPGVTSRVFMAQFCLTVMNYEPGIGMTMVVDLPDTGETWEMTLEFDGKDSLWKVNDVQKLED